MKASLCLAFLLTLGLAAKAADTLNYATAPAGEHWVIIKADDMTGEHRAEWTRFVDIAQKQQIPVSIGIINNSFQKQPAEYAVWLHSLASTAQIEYWNHGWDHANWKVDGKDLFEFGGSGFDHQKSDFDQAQKISSDHGVPLACFGSPNNKMDADTATVLNAHPEITSVFCYRGDTACTGQLQGKLLFPMDLRGEGDGTGKPNFAKFQKEYADNPTVTFTALQFHPPYFTEAGAGEFNSIVQFLKEKRWKFVLPRDFKPLTKSGTN